MEIKDISRDRLEHIAQVLMERVSLLEGKYSYFASALGEDGITLEEAKVFGYQFNTYGKVDHRVADGYRDKGTYHLNFDNDETGLADATEFYAEDRDELIDFWYRFCNENSYEPDWLTSVEFICYERI